MWISDPWGGILGSLGSTDGRGLSGRLALPGAVGVVAMAGKGTVMAELGRCATCRHWELITADDVPLGKWSERRGKGYCHAIGQIEGDNSIWPVECQAVVASHEAEVGWLVTLPTFGCVMWESREPLDA